MEEGRCIARPRLDRAPLIHWMEESKVKKIDGSEANPWSDCMMYPIAKCLLGSRGMLNTFTCAS